MVGIRSLVQVRPKEGDGVYYNPQRDLAYVYAPAMREALRALDEAHWTPEIRELCEKAAVTERHISEAVQCLLDAHQLFLRDDISQPVDALTQAGWYNCSACVRYLVYGRLGEVMLGGFFVALRDVTSPDSLSPVAKDMALMLAAGRQLQERESGMKPEETPVAVLRVECKALQHLVEQAESQLATNMAQLRKLRENLAMKTDAAARLEHLQTQAAGHIAELQASLSTTRQQYQTFCGEGLRGWSLMRYGLTLVGTGLRLMMLGRV